MAVFIQLALITTLQKLPSGALASQHLADRSHVGLGWGTGALGSNPAFATDCLHHPSGCFSSVFLQSHLLYAFGIGVVTGSCVGLKTVYAAFGRQYQISACYS